MKQYTNFGLYVPNSIQTSKLLDVRRIKLKLLHTTVGLLNPILSVWNVFRFPNVICFEFGLYCQVSWKNQKGIINLNLYYWCAVILPDLKLKKLQMTYCLTLKGPYQFAILFCDMDFSPSYFLIFGTLGWILKSCYFTKCLLLKHYEESLICLGALSFGCKPS